MKNLLIAIFLLGCFSIYAGEPKELIVKYDKDYYSPVASVAKFDLILPPIDKSGYYVNFSLDKNGKILYDKSFLVDTPETTISLYFYIDSTSLYIPADLKMPDIQIGFCVNYRKPYSGLGTGFVQLVPHQYLTMFCRKRIKINWGKQAVFAELKNKQPSNKRCPFGMAMICFVSDNHPDLADVHIALSVGIAKTDIWEKGRKARKLIEQKEIDKVLSLVAYKNLDYGKMSDAELLKWYGRIVADRDYIEEKYKAAKVRLRDLSKMQGQLSQIAKFIWDRGLKGKNSGLKSQKKQNQTRLLNP